MSKQVYGNVTTYDGKLSHSVYVTLFSEEDWKQEKKDKDKRQKKLNKLQQNMEQLQQEMKMLHLNSVQQKIEELYPSNVDENNETQYGDALPFNCWRRELYKKPVKTKSFKSAEEKTNVVKKMKVIFTVFPDINVGKLTFEFKFKKATASQLIYLRQCNTNGMKITKDGSIAEIYKIIKEKTGFCGGNEQWECFIELNRFDNFDNTTDILASMEAKKQLYGIISGDEGWRYIPDELAEQRITTAWSSRKFVSLIIFGNSFLLLNLKKYEIARTALKNQKRFFKWYYKKKNPSFEQNQYERTIEGIMVITPIMNRIQEFFQKERTGSLIKYNKLIKQIKEYRQELMYALICLEKTDITEIGNLQNVILSQKEFTQLIDRGKYLLDSLANELTLQYQRGINIIMAILAFLALFPISQLLGGVIENFNVIEDGGILEFLKEIIFDSVSDCNCNCSCNCDNK